MRFVKLSKTNAVTPSYERPSIRYLGSASIPQSFFGCGKGTVFEARRDCQTPSFPELVIEYTSTRPSPEIAGLDR
jgi:hypothetical protein